MNEVMSYIGLLVVVFIIVYFVNKHNKNKPTPNYEWNFVPRDKHNDDIAKYQHKIDELNETVNEYRTQISVMNEYIKQLEHELNKESV